MPRGEDAKRHSRLREARQLGSEAAKRNCHCEAKSCKVLIKFFENPLSQSHSIKREFENFLSLFNCKISSLPGRECGCCNQFNYNHERGVNKKKHKNTDRATECAMTNVVKNLRKTTVGRHCEITDECKLVE